MVTFGVAEICIQKTMTSVNRPSGRQQGVRVESQQLLKGGGNGKGGIRIVALHCAIPQDYLSDTPLLRAMGFLVSQHGQLVRYHLPLF